VFRNRKCRRTSYHRIILGACVGGAIQSSALLWGQWALPRGTTGAVIAMGSYQTCAAQGFLLHMFGHMCHTYMTSLSVHGLLFVRYNFAQGKLIKAFEACAHVMAWLYPTCSAIFLVATDSFGSSMAFCYLKPGLILFYFGALPLLISLTVSTGVIASLGLMVFHKERTCNIDTLQGKRRYQENARRERSRGILKQRAMYFAILCVVYIVIIVSRCSLGVDHVPFYIVAVVFLSLQGSLVSLVYYRFVAISEEERRRLSGSVYSSWVSQSSRPSSVHLSRISTTHGHGKDALENKSVGDKAEYEIYDGSNPSSQWAMFILDDEDSGDEFGYGTADETNYPQDSTGQTDLGAVNTRKSTCPDTEFRDEDVAENGKR